jgi:hypothetical protein
MTSVPSVPLSLFIRCGERYAPPAAAGPWEVITLPGDLGPNDLPAAVTAAREALCGRRSARVLVAGPVALGIALGQGLAHEPVAIDYLQLNQVSKDFEVWLSNRRNL